MRKTTLTFSAAALALAAAGTALLAQAPDGGRGPDANGDGQVTRAEMIAHAATMFGALDVNKDGKLDAADRAAHETRGFNEMDADNNGEISAAEMKAHHLAMMQKHEAEMAQHFAAMDTDHSGGLSREELKAAHAGHEGMGPRPGKPGGMHGGDGPQAGHGPGHGPGFAGPMMMMRADADNDKVVTKAEFEAAAAAHFAKADTDKDGQLSNAEMEAMHPRGSAHRGHDAPPPGDEGA